MRIVKWIAAAMAAAFLSAPLCAQQKAVEAGSSDSATAYRVQVVLSELDGTTKVSSLPYTIPVAYTHDEPRAQGSLRVGIRVPINTSTKSAENAIQYIDIGTNIDVRVKHADTERYDVELTLERSSLYVREQNKEGKVEGRTWMPGDPAPSLTPPLNTLRTNMRFLLRDGRAGETASITDPITGHVLKVETLLTVLK